MTRIHVRGALGESKVLQKNPTLDTGFCEKIRAAASALKTKVGVSNLGLALTPAWPLGPLYLSGA